MTLDVLNCLLELNHLAAQPAPHLQQLVLKVLVRNSQVNLDVEVLGGERALTALVLDLHVVLQNVLLNTVGISIALAKLALPEDQKVFAEIPVFLRYLSGSISFMYALGACNCFIERTQMILLEKKDKKV